jgi:hypothetical protein
MFEGRFVGAGWLKLDYNVFLSHDIRAKVIVVVNNLQDLVPIIEA